MAYQVLINKESTREFADQNEAISFAKFKRPPSRWVEVQDAETGHQVFASREFEHDDHLTKVQGLINLLKGSDSALPPADVLAHLHRTVSICEVVLLTLPGSHGYAGVALSRFQCIAEPFEPGCNRHFFLLTQGYPEGYSAELYATRREALDALTSRLGRDEVPLAALFS